MSKRKKPGRTGHRLKKPTGSRLEDYPSSPQRLAEILDEVRRADPEIALRMYQMIIGTCRVWAEWERSELGDSRDAELNERVRLEAMFGAARSLRWLDRHEEAAEQFRELLQTDSADRHFARYWLAACLFDLERHEELRKVLAQRDEATAVWRYAQALFAFRTTGDNDESVRLLQEARDIDSRFLDYLLGEDMVNASWEVRFDGSSEESAHSCGRLFLPAWRSTPGAATWARRTLRIPVQLEPPDVEPPFPRRELLQLPKRDVTWQIGLHLMEDDEDDEDQDEPQWLMMVVNVDEKELTKFAVIEEDELTPQRVWREVLLAMRHPVQGEPHRPGTLVIPRREFQQAWQKKLDEIGVKSVYERDPQPVGQMIQGFAVFVKHHKLPRTIEGVDPNDYPQSDDVWQADFYHSPELVTNEQVGAIRPWAVFVFDKATHFVLSNEYLPGDPAPELMWDCLVRTIAHSGKRVRPAVVEVSDSDTYDFLKPKLAECGVRCVLVDELRELNDFCHRLASSKSPEKSSLAEGVGVTMEIMEEFYHEAARYFNAAPWKFVRGEIPIRIGCRGLDTGTRYGIVLGRTGVQLGLALYDDYEAVRRMLRGLTPPEGSSALALLYDEEIGMGGEDLFLIERNGWPIASPEAYPLAVRVHGEESSAPPVEELRLLIGCLRVVPDFVKRGDAKTYEVAVTDKRFKLRLAWA